jgi:hypothetical protein
MRALGIICYVFAVLLLALNLIAMFTVWSTYMGIGGVLISIFLIFIALSYY